MRPPRWHDADENDGKGAVQMRILARPVVQTTVVAIMAAFVALILGVTQTLTTAITAAIG